MAGQRGFLYEGRVFNKLKSKNLVPSGVRPAGPDPSKPDAVFLYDKVPHNLEVKLGSQKATDSVILNKFSESVVADLIEFDGSKPLDRDDGVITNMHFSSEVIDNPDSNLDKSVIIIPSVTGTITIYFAEEFFEEDQDEDYWNFDNDRNLEVVETIKFSYFGDQMSVIYESGKTEEGPNFNPFIFDTSEFYGNSGDYAIVVEFTNDLGSDLTVKQGQSSWKWFHICKTNSDGTCSD